MSPEFSPTCVPDKYLNEILLKALFNDFNVSIEACQPAATIFSSLVNNVRQVYMAALLGVNEELLSQFKVNARQLTTPKREREQEHGSPPKYGAGKFGGAVTPVPCDVETPTLTKGAADVAGDLGGRETSQTSAFDEGKVRQERISWPANTFTIHVGSCSEDFRRDMPDWGSMNRDGWIERLDFKVFKYEEPGTIKISVMDCLSIAHRMMADRELSMWGTGGWKKRLEFYAYERARPGTRMIWVAYRKEPERCIFLKGDQADKLEGWERKCKFWVPV